MSITALTSAPVEIQIHVITAIMAVGLGPIALLRARRDLIHKVLGYTWATSMLATALSSMFISETPMLGPFSPIHILSLITFGGLFYAMRAALRRDFMAHGRAMRALYAQALIIPGVFTFLPMRRMNALVGFGESWMVFALACVIGIAVMAAVWLHPSLSRALGARGRRIPLFFGRLNR